MPDCETDVAKPDREEVLVSVEKLDVVVPSTGNTLLRNLRYDTLSTLVNL